VRTSSSSVRSGRSAPVIAVTRAGSPVGAAVVARLARLCAPGASQVVAVDDVPAPDLLPGGVRWCSADLASPQVREALAGAEVVVHVASPGDAGAPPTQPLSVTARRAHAVRAAQQVAAAAADVGARRLVVLTDAMVYGAGPDRPDPISEDSPLLAVRDESVVGDLLEVERIVARLPRVHPGLRTTVVRPAALVGPGIDTTVTRHLREARLLALRGAEMRWQFCHVEDLADAAALAIDADLDGVLTAGTWPALTDDDVERLTGMRRVQLPARLAYATAERLGRSRSFGAGAADLTYVVHPWVVGSERLRAAGWEPRHGGAACLREIRAGATFGGDGDAPGPPVVDAPGARVEPREAALGAVGAAVAILGTAALLRQARARRAGRPRPRL
jgi:nucleoside-diphosphate-sugar epimerase